MIKERGGLLLLRGATRNSTGVISCVFLFSLFRAKPGSGFWIQFNFCAAICTASRFARCSFPHFPTMKIAG